MNQNRPAETEPVAPERLQKVMARSGMGSRRGLEKTILAGEITINGKTAELGSAVSAGQKVGYRNKMFRVVTTDLSQETLFYNKPVGELTTRDDPQQRKTIFDRLPKPKQGRWVAIGRLDINTSGLLILTTDGELANVMMHPSSRVDREYACRIHGEVKDENLQNLRSGVQLDDGVAKFNDIAVGGVGDTNRWYQVTILEGRNREVRRLWETQGLQVSRLQRVRYGAAFLPKGLLRGKWHRITPHDHRVLRQDVGLKGSTNVLMLQPEKAPVNQLHSKKTTRKKTTKRKPIKGRLRIKSTASTTNPATSKKYQRKKR